MLRTVSHFWPSDLWFRRRFHTFGHPTLDFDECFTLLATRPLILTNVLHFWTPEPWVLRMFHTFGHTTPDSDECSTFLDNFSPGSRALHPYLRASHPYSRAPHPCLWRMFSHFWIFDPWFWRIVHTSGHWTLEFDECLTLLVIGPLILTNVSHFWPSDPWFDESFTLLALRPLSFD